MLWCSAVQGSDEGPGLLHTDPGPCRETKAHRQCPSHLIGLQLLGKEGCSGWYVVSTTY